MGLTPQDRLGFPADELFYRGKLLPLHLRPRLQMVKRLQSPRSRRSYHGRDQGFVHQDGDELQEEDTFSLPTVLIMPPTAPHINMSAWSNGSSDILPSESCRPSCELNHVEDDCFFQWSNELQGFIPCDEKKQILGGSSCSDPSSSSSALRPKWLKQIKQSLICQKLKAPKAYLMSLFSKTKGRGLGGGGRCLGGPGVGDPCNMGLESVQGLGWSKKLPRRAPSEQNDYQGRNCNYQNLSLSVMKRIHRELAESGAISSHRKSSSAALQQHFMANTPSPNSLSSSSSSSSSLCSSLSSFKLNSGVMSHFQLLKQSSDARSGLENSIEGAIAHCKKSHKLLPSQKSTDTTTSEIASLSLH